MTSSTAPALASLLACVLNAGCASSGAMQRAQPQDERAQPQDERAQPQDDGAHKSYVLPVIEMVAMDAALNFAGRLVLEPATFEVSRASLRRNLRGPWVVDDDPFEVNQFWHPYQGAMYHSIARSNGQSYWDGLYLCRKRDVGNRR